MHSGFTIFPLSDFDGRWNTAGRDVPVALDLFGDRGVGVAGSLRWKSAEW